MRLFRAHMIVVATCWGWTSSAAADERIVLPDGTVIAEVDFERHVASLLGRLGCNSAACHGSFQGKGGFKLSLFGQSAAMDYAAIMAKPESSRVRVESPDDSLLLQKPSGRETHGGGIRLREGSWEYRLVRDWIAAGARRTPESGTVVRLVVEPAQVKPLTISQSVGLRVLAEFAGGQREDITAFCEFRSRDETVATCDSSGKITAMNSGDTSITVSYRGTFVGVPIVVPYPADQAPAAPPVSDNLIDEEINAKLRQLGLSVSPQADDVEFLRRATLDVLGTIPTPEEVRGFVADANPQKRSATIDSLLTDPRRAALWAAKMCDITACNVDVMGSPEELRPKWAKMWYDWFRKRFAENQRYDEMVRGVLCATSRDAKTLDAWIDDELGLVRSAQAGFDSAYRDRPSLDLFWRRIGPQGPLPVEDQTELIASAFLGLRMHCARCHQHPYDRWTQHDFAGLANIFARVEYGSSTELRVGMNQRLEQRRQARAAGQTLPELPRLLEVFLSQNSRLLTDADIGVPQPAKIPAGPTLFGDRDLREVFVEWLTTPDNPYFAKSFVNRLWAKYFGSGLVEPVDAFSTGNPSTHPRLLERLASEFVRSGFDIAHMERLILSSQAYQRSSVPTGNNTADRHNVARAPVRPLMAEVLLDTINAALESSDDFGPDVPAGSQAIEVAPNRLSKRETNDLFRALGRGDRKSFCDCDRATGPSLRQPLFLMRDPRVINKVRAGRLARLLDQGKTDTEIIEEFYLATLCRLPDDQERDFALRHVTEQGDRREALVDLVWSLVNVREFCTNH